MEEIRGGALGAAIPGAQFIRPYYTSTIEPGPRRLADNIAESAFFTKLLAGKVSTTLWVVTGGAVSGTLAALALSDLFAVDSQTMVSVFKSIGIFVAFLISGDFALTAKKYSDLANEAQKAFNFATQLRVNASATIEEARTVAEEYGIALLQAPPVPSWLYGCYREDLNKMYRESHG